MFPKRTTVALMLTLCVGVRAEPAGTVVSMREASAATFYVPARLPGLAPGELMVDTGSGFMTINETTLEQLQHGEQVEYVKKVEGVLADGSRLVVPIYRISRLDIGERCTLRDVEAAVRAINPSARIHRTQRSGVPLAEVLDRGAFDLKRAIDNDPHFLDHHDHDHDHDHECGPDCDHDHHHHHDGHHHHHDHGVSPIHDVSVQSISLRGGEMDPKKFFPWIEKTTQMDGPNILRLKGIIAFKDDPERYVVQGVHMILEGDHQRAWKDGETHESRLVFIGRDLDTERLKRTFEACQA